MPALTIRSLLNEAFARSAIEVTPVAESTSMALIQRLVMLGEGIALLNALDVLEELEELERGSLSFVPLRDAHLQRQTLVQFVRKGAELSAAAALMAASIESALARLFARKH